MYSYFLTKAKSVLDVACGRGKWGFLIKSSDKSPRLIVGIDIWLPNLKFVKTHKIYDDVILCNAKKLPFKESQFDLVLACEVLEHLYKSESYAILKEVERVAKRKVIVTTPNLRIQQGEKGGNPFERHKSRWTSAELKKIGYMTYGVGFSFFGYFTTDKLKAALSPLGYFFPRMSYALVGEKKMVKKLSQDFSNQTDGKPNNQR